MPNASSFLLGDEIVADHPRQFRRDQIIYDPWHYLPVLMKKPAAYAPYEIPELPDIHLYTLEQNPDQLAEYIVAELVARGVVSRS